MVDALPSQSVSDWHFEKLVLREFSVGASGFAVTVHCTECETGCQKMLLLHAEQYKIFEKALNKHHCLCVGSTNSTG